MSRRSAPGAIDPARRRLLAAAAAACLPRGSRSAMPAGGVPAAGGPRVIVVGAGFGGATCARYLRLLSPATQVLLIERRAQFLTGPFSNLVIAGLRSPSSITRHTAAIGRSHQVGFLQADVADIDPTALAVTLADGRRLQADRIVLSPGIAMREGTIEGLDAHTGEAMPHAWLGDGQVDTLRRRLAAVPDGATLLIAAPANPYRCPPGPYERASLMAHALKSRGRGRSKILIADAKDDFSKSALFKLEWDALYPGMIEWIPRSAGGEVVRIDAAAGNVWLRGSAAPVHTALASIVPAQQAAALAVRADLTDDSGWCPVDAGSFESRRHAHVHVLGDACAGAPMPKSAFAANSQAKLCASAIAAAFRGAPPPEARLLNTCYSMVSESEAISVSGLYAADAAGKLGVVSEGMSPLAAGNELRRREARQARAWYDGITRDSFG